MSAKKTLNTKKLQGTARKDRDAKQGVKMPPADDALLRTPPGLPKEAQKLWRQLAPWLKDAGLLSSGDVVGLMLTCVHAGVAIEAARMLREEGITRQDENNVTRKHPAYQLVRDGTAQFWKGSEKFGLSPADRNKIKLPEVGEELTLAEELFQMVVK